jgi:hypothetical protein
MLLEATVIVSKLNTQGGNFYLKDPIRRHFIHGVFASQIHATVLCLERILNANNPEVLRV